MDESNSQMGAGPSELGKSFSVSGLESIYRRYGQGIYTFACASSPTKKRRSPQLWTCLFGSAKSWKAIPTNHKLSCGSANSQSKHSWRGSMVAAERY